MKISRGLELWRQFKRPPPNWGSEIYNVELTPEDIGFTQVTTENRELVVALMELECRKRTVTSAFMDGLLSIQDVKNMIEPYVLKVKQLKGGGK